ncbi:hypothetical protein JG687_00017107, partial [Phytophthora cactorum]
MCRSKSVEIIQTSHLVCADDSVGIVLHKTKSNQEGSGPKDPRHLYANPGSPVTCWLTALAIYLACYPRLQPGALFPGSNQKLRCGKALAQCLKGDSEASETKCYGTHSIRKGVASFASGGSTGWPSIVSICLCCGWSLGGVQDRYFRYESAGDQYLGRVVAALPLNSSAFATQPPHFADPHNSAVGVAAGNITRNVLEQTIRQLLAEAGVGTTALANGHSEYQQESSRNVHFWGGKFHFLPANFEFPSADPLTTSMLWWFGNSTLGYPPLYRVTSRDLS